MAIQLQRTQQQRLDNLCADNIGLITSLKLSNDKFKSHFKVFIVRHEATVDISENDAVEISLLVTFAGDGLGEYSGKHMKTAVLIGK